MNKRIKKKKKFQDSIYMYLLGIEIVNNLNDYGKRYLARLRNDKSLDRYIRKY